MGNLNLEQQASDLLRQFDAKRNRRVLKPRPFTIELFGTPKSGKTTMKEMLKHFFKRNGWLPITPIEGAEAVTWPKRLEPDYNFQTGEYAMTLARELAYGPGHQTFHVAIFDRALYDVVVRMEYYLANGVITPDQRAAIEGYFRMPQNQALFDCHICLVASPEVAMQREVARVLTKKDGETMNRRVLQGLLDAHQAMWERLRCAQDPRFAWHDSSSETEVETGQAILAHVLSAFERRLANGNGLAS
jgi:hypothetical protein